MGGGAKEVRGWEGARVPFPLEAANGISSPKTPTMTGARPKRNGKKGAASAEGNTGGEHPRRKRGGGIEEHQVTCRSWNRTSSLSRDKSEKPSLCENLKRKKKKYPGCPGARDFGLRRGRGHLPDLRAEKSGTVLGVRGKKDPNGADRERTCRNGPRVEGNARISWYSALT